MEECPDRRLFRHGQDHVCQRPLLFLPGSRYELSSLRVITDLFMQLQKRSDMAPRDGQACILTLLYTIFLVSDPDRACRNQSEDQETGDDKEKRIGTIHPHNPVPKGIAEQLHCGRNDESYDSKDFQQSHIWWKLSHVHSPHVQSQKGNLSVLYIVRRSEPFGRQEPIRE
jgi:hypothetical protein